MWLLPISTVKGMAFSLSLLYLLSPGSCQDLQFASPQNCNKIVLELKNKSWAGMAAYLQSYHSGGRCRAQGLTRLVKAAQTETPLQ